MQSFDEIRQIINMERPRIEGRYPLRLLSIFGSFARGEENDGSDVDILAEQTGEGLSLFDVVRVEDDLSCKIGHPVELVFASRLKPRIKNRILSDARPL
jgi:uncharacterized protein